jgi:hypothetical protein
MEIRRQLIITQGTFSFGFMYLHSMLIVRYFLFQGCPCTLQHVMMRCVRVEVKLHLMTSELDGGSGHLHAPDALSLVPIG